MHYVYVLRNKNIYYIGCTNNIKRRIKQHEKSRPGFRLEYYEGYKDSKLTRQREQRLKHYGSAWRGLKSRIEQA